MKKIFKFVYLFLLLAGCSSFSPEFITVVQDHKDVTVETTDSIKKSITALRFPTDVSPDRPPQASLGVRRES